MVRLKNVDAPKQMLSDSRNVGGIRKIRIETKFQKNCDKQVSFLLHTCSTTIIIVVQSGASRQEHH